MRIQSKSTTNKTSASRFHGMVDVRVPAQVMRGEFTFEIYKPFDRESSEFRISLKGECLIDWRGVSFDARTLEEFLPNHEDLSDVQRVLLAICVAGIVINVNELKAYHGGELAMAMAQHAGLEAHMFSKYRWEHDLAGRQAALVSRLLT